jgi:hypothetical protein
MRYTTQRVPPLERPDERPGPAPAPFLRRVGPSTSAAKDVLPSPIRLSAHNEASLDLRLLLLNPNLVLVGVGVVPYPGHLPGDVGVGPPSGDPEVVLLYPLAM